MICNQVKRINTPSQKPTTVAITTVAMTTVTMSTELTTTIDSLTSHETNDETAGTLDRIKLSELTTDAKPSNNIKNVVDERLRQKRKRIPWQGITVVCTISLLLVVGSLVVRKICKDCN